VAARTRWEAGELSQEETATYDSAASPIKYLASDSKDLTEVAAGQRIAHMAGMQALEDRWEENRALEEGPPAQLCPQQQAHSLVPQRSQQQGQLPRRPQQRQTPGTASYAQRAQAAAALPQADYTRVGQNGKAEKKPSGLEQAKRSLLGMRG